MDFETLKKKYLLEFLLSDEKDYDQFKDILTFPNFFNIPDAEIKSMHYILVKRTLQRFGFRTFIDIENNKIVENVEHWLKNVISNIESVEISNLIQNNTKLLEYLEKLCNIANNNQFTMNGY
jgi:hypothetical protein